jgi:ABC-type multidrug transport system fused ATPase/permease subunit
MIKTLKTFFRFMTEKHLAYGAYIVSIVVAGILSNISPYFYKLLVEAIPSQNYQLLLRVTLIYLGVNVVSLTVGELSFMLGNYNLIDAATKLRATVFAWVQDLDFAFHSGKSTGSLISAFKRGDNAFFDFSFIVHHRLLDITIAFAVLFFFFIRLDPRIALIALISIIVTLIATKFLIENNIAKRNAFNDEEDRVTDIITDNLINYETVKLFAKEGWELGRLKEVFKSWRKRLWIFFNTYRTIDFTIGSIINFGIFAILLFSIKATTDLKMGVGDFVMVATFIGMFFPRLWELVWSLRDIAKNYSDLQRYFGLLDYSIEVKDPARPVGVRHILGEITFKNIKFSYKNRFKNAIDGISLKINQDQSVALVGRSGSGKTTLVKLLMRFYDVTSGEILLDGINIKDFTKDRLRSFIGVVPQEPILFNNTIAYNIGYGLPRRQAGKSKAKPAEIRAAAKLANIDDFIQSLPKKYETEVGERGVKLSGGQKQRLAIARMILSDPDIVIFDEATSQLDSESEKLIQEAFWKARAGKTTIIIAHRLSTVMKADKIVVMEGGKIKETGTHESLLKQKDSLYSHFWNLQIKLD